MREWSRRPQAAVGGAWAEVVDGCVAAKFAPKQQPIVETAVSSCVAHSDDVLGGQLSAILLMTINQLYCCRC